jgi:hypothetical protein
MVVPERAYEEHQEKYEAGVGADGAAAWMGHGMRGGWKNGG